ncbi:hypothetical protein Dimus_002925 [Dionaea muscipula]
MAAIREDKSRKKRKASELKLKEHRDRERLAKAPRREWEAKEDEDDKREQGKEDAMEGETTAADMDATEPKLEVEGRHQWRNLNLLLSIEEKELDAQKKVDMVLDYVKSRAVKDDNDEDGVPQILSSSRVIMHVSNWIQSLLIASEKKARAAAGDVSAELLGFCLDSRCWEIFRFCLKESLTLHVSLSLSRDLLRVINCVVGNAFYLYKDVSLSKKGFFEDKDAELYSLICDCISFIFSSHGGISNGNLDLWVGVVDSVLQLVIEIYEVGSGTCGSGDFLIKLSCFVLESFFKFLRAHPCRKSGFRDFVSKLLEPLLHILGLLQDQIDGSSLMWTVDLRRFIEEVISYGLFHPVHIDDFLSLRSTEWYSSSTAGKLDSKTTIKSYHRHLFDKLENIALQRKGVLFAGIGELFHLFVYFVKKQRRDSLKGGSSRLVKNQSFDPAPKGLSSNSRIISEKNDHSPIMNFQTRKSIFDFFVLTMELLLLDWKTKLKSESQVGVSLLDILGAVKLMNKMLSTMKDEKLYQRTEDTIGGAMLNFFKVMYSMVVSRFMEVNELWLPTCAQDGVAPMDILILTAKELVLALRGFIEIEYRVLGDDLVDIWLMIIAFLSMSDSVKGMPRVCPLTSVTIDLACELVKLYSDLRQVSRAVVALCSSVRHLSFSQSDKELKDPKLLLSLSSSSFGTFVKSARFLLCSQKFRCAISNAIQTIPEGQASECLGKVTKDISASLEWMNAGCSAEVEDKPNKVRNRGFNVKSELFGVLSEIYTQILDSISVTIGNGKAVAVSVEKLVMVLHPYLTSVLALEQGGCEGFVLSATENTLKSNKRKSKTDAKNMYLWMCLFFFHLYLSCRSLFKQAVSLNPPDSSKDMDFGDPFTTYFGCDWTKRTDQAVEGYFSWIFRASASLHAVVQFVMHNFVQEDSTGFFPLVYVMHAMAFQRLVDLNRQIQLIEYLVLADDNLLKSKLIDGVGPSLLPKKRKKWEKLLTGLRQEAASLANFVLGYISMYKGTQLSVSTVGKEIANDSSTRTHEENDQWDLAVCSVNQKTLPIALWWITCQNLDIWCIHAAKSKLKLFLSLLISSALPLEECDVEDVRKNANNYTGDLTGVTVHQTSLELLHDTVFYEQRFVRRYLASSFCHVLEKILPPSADSTNVYVKLNSLPDWKEFLSALDISSITACNKGLVDDCYQQQTSFAIKSSTIAAFQYILNLLCQVPKRSLSLKSFKTYATFLLNCERVLVGSLMESCCTSSSWKRNCLVRLLVSCRRALKYLNMEFCEHKIEANEYSVLPIFSESNFPILWLLKSVNVVVECLNNLHNDEEVNEMVLSLIDHTSYACSTFCKYQFAFGIKILLENKNSREEHRDNGHNYDRIGPSESAYPINSISASACKSVASIAETLKDQIIVMFSEVPAGQESNVAFGMGNKILPLMSSIRGFLWGLASAIYFVDVKDHNLIMKLVKYKLLSMDSISPCIDKFVEFMDSVTKMFFMDNTREPGTNNDALLQSPSVNDATSHEVGQPLQDGSDGMDIVECTNQQLNSETENMSLLSSDVDDDSGSSAYIKNPLSNVAHLSVGLLKQVDSSPLCENLLRGFFSGENLNLASLLRELFIASSAVLRLNMRLKCSPLLPSLMEFLLGSSQFLLMELSNKKEVPMPYSFTWLDASLKFLEDLGSHFTVSSPTMTRNVHSRLINLYLKAIGKCISLQGKRATLFSPDMGSSINSLGSQKASSESYVSHELYWMEELKARLRMSFKVLIKQSSELQLLSIVQAIERALFGVHEGWTVLYEVNIGGAGGCASSAVAAGVDCLDLVLECVTGHKRMSAVRRRIQSLIASLFNIILHLQGPAIFYKKLNVDEANATADSGAVVLMGVEVLITIARKHVFFRMDPGHVGQYLRIPAALFQDFHHLRLCKASHLTNNQPAAISLLLDNQFSLTLYAASCRLLCTVVKHHKSECIQYIALLQKSIQTLLHSLELVDIDSSYKEGYFTWEVQEGIKCASQLRRVYEEIRQQRDVFGQHCFLFVSDYIWIYSGYGPLKRGIKREIDDALRPGVYALVDVCSAKDLQYLHTVFGEGPCRSTLATLRQDYKMNFQYEGKV